ncbi:MAG: nucleoside hydrolase [Gammaproteobacteria bacterium]|nr:nucleoside hydrolase [Gammaproteobacteria bacterium]
MSTRLLIDTDVALGLRHEGRPRDIDDGFAIVEAINVDDLELRGVTTVFGNAPHDAVHRVAAEIIRLKKAAVPVVPGAARPLPQAGDLPDPNPAVEFMASQLAQTSMAIAAIGPLTNIGLLVHHYPEVLTNITSLIIVAGRSIGASFYIGDIGPVRDFNFEHDVRAAELVMTSSVPLVLAGFELTSQVTITQADLATIAAQGGTTAEYFHTNSLAWCQYWIDAFAEPGFHPWDSAAIAWLRHPEYFQCEARGWRIDRTGETPRLECDRNLPGPTVTYCTGFAPAGSDSFVRDVVSTVY